MRITEIYYGWKSKRNYSGLMIPRRLDDPRTANTLMKYYPMSHTISLHLSPEM